MVLGFSILFIHKLGPVKMQVLNGEHHFKKSVYFYPLTQSLSPGSEGT
jgi:hypothetical protein